MPYPDFASHRLLSLDGLLLAGVDGIAIVAAHLGGIDDGLPCIWATGTHDPGSGLPQRRLAPGSCGDAFGPVPADRHDARDHAGKDSPEQGTGKNSAADAPPYMLALRLPRGGVTESP